MDIRSHIMRFRAKKWKTNRSNPLGLIGLLIALFISISAAGGLIYSVFWYAEITKDLPPPELMERLLDPPAGSLIQPTRIYDRSGQQVLWEFENPLVENRRYVSITDGSILFFHDVSENFINAILAVNDPEYFNKPDTFLGGIRFTRLDPIPYHLVSELLLWNEDDHPYRESRTNLLADQIVARYGREKILEWYLNNLFFGNQIYGVEQASQIYFGKPARDLGLEESALLAGVASFPSLNPYDSPEAARDNQRDILGTMADTGMITQAELKRAMQKQIIYPDPDGASDRKKPAFVEYILKEAEAIIPVDQLTRGGYKITSTLDNSIQNEMSCTAELMISRIKGKDPELDLDCEASRLLPKYSGPLLEDSDPLEINLVYLDPLRGELLGMVGLSSEGEFTRLDIPRSPGTELTPFIYLNHFTKGFEPASLVWDIHLDDTILNNIQMHPGCGEDCDFQGPVNIRKAMTNDFLSPAQQLWESQGMNQVEKTLASFGFSVGVDYCQDCDIFPGTPLLDIIDLAQGYGVFVNQGFLRGRKNIVSNLDVQPASIMKIEDLSGLRTIPELIYSENKIISEQLAFMINNVLSDIDSRENGDDFQIGRPVGVKPGYVPDSESAWVIGYTPRTVAAVWTGSPNKVDQQTVDHTQISTALWRAIIQHTSREQEINDWEMPSRMITLDVCYPSGMLLVDHCPLEVREIFIQGNEPQSVDTLYQIKEVNRETGLLASVFTPVRLVEERVYLEFPLEALKWAEESEIAAPPTLYDLDFHDPETVGFTISRPKNLSFVNGQVGILGSIPPEDFLSARLQFGSGMNPGSWVQIGPDINDPGDAIWLGSLDTTELDDGVYALQLVLIKENQQIKKVSRIVSVDNTIPVIDFNSDISEGTVEYIRGKDFLFEAEFVNNSEIDQVDFYLNGLLLGSRKTPPYLIPWEMQLGEYQLMIKAIDLAGNQAELVVDFNVNRD